MIVVGKASMTQSFPMYELNSNGGARRTPHHGNATLCRKSVAKNGAGNGKASGQELSESQTPPNGASSEHKDQDNAAVIQALAAEVRKAQAGDIEAMHALIESNRAWVRGIAYAVLGDAHLAEDAAQDVCVRM